MVILGLSSVLFQVAAQARAGTLQNCEGISTANGFMYVGTYCVDYQCEYVTRRMFRSWCPFSIN